LLIRILSDEERHETLSSAYDEQLNLNRSINTDLLREENQHLFLHPYRPFTTVFFLEALDIREYCLITQTQLSYVLKPFTLQLNIPT